MEEKDISGIADAVAKELAKLNAYNKPEEKKPEEKKPEEKKPEEVFNCPDCGASVIGGIGYCQSCGCQLEWSD